MHDAIVMETVAIDVMAHSPDGRVRVDLQVKATTNRERKWKVTDSILRLIGSRHGDHLTGDRRLIFCLRSDPAVPDWGTAVLPRLPFRGTLFFAHIYSLDNDPLLTMRETIDGIVLDGATRLADRDEGETG
jgi:hypothetical protein